MTKFKNVKLLVSNQELRNRFLYSDEALKKAVDKIKINIFPIYPSLEKYNEMSDSVMTSREYLGQAANIKFEDGYLIGDVILFTPNISDFYNHSISVFGKVILLGHEVEDYSIEGVFLTENPVYKFETIRELLKRKREIPIENFNSVWNESIWQ